MAKSEMFEKGLEVRRKKLGAEYVDGGIAKADDFRMAFRNAFKAGHEVLKAEGALPVAAAE
jgi:hypothetical protein